MEVASTDFWDHLSWPGNLTLLTAAELRQPDFEGVDGGTAALPFTVTVKEQEPPTKYWVKALEGPEGKFALIAEAIVSRLGKLTGAPVCETSFIDVSAYAGNMIAPGHDSQYRLSHSVAYGSRDIPGATSHLVIRHRTVGDNAARLARDYVLYEWCLGGDDQWLTDPADRQTYSHDHGRWLSQDAMRRIDVPTWSASTLDAELETHRGNHNRETAIQPNDVREAAARAANISRNDLVAVLDPIVTAWGDAGIVFPDGLSLEATMRRVGHWLEIRRDIVTDRLSEYPEVGT
ncbi:hypothetical protein AB0E55_04675 [Amycolatopsis keratiniphila]|uniref:hypothetical protein n=1 Tax=Amycolatopsis keratiniphila TaxID=129921 RepID=UPI0033FBACC7